MNLSTTDLSLAAGASIDLHLHTTYSDGCWTPESLLDYLLSEQFGLVAITDHDRVDTAIAIQQLALEKHLPVLVGVEMTTIWKGEMTDLLCFGFDPNDNALDDLARDLLHRQQQNTQEVYENLQRQGYAFPSDALAVLLAQPSAQQPHALVALLKEHDNALDDSLARRLLWESGITFATNEPAAVVEAAHLSGAVCMLAHPGRDYGLVYDVDLLDQFRREAPIDGLEVYYPEHTPGQTAMYREYAQRHHLLICAGSDSHDLNEQPPIKYRAELCRDLLEWLGIQVA